MSLGLSSQKHKRMARDTNRPQSSIPANILTKYSKRSLSRDSSNTSDLYATASKLKFSTKKLYQTSQ